MCPAAEDDSFSAGASDRTIDCAAGAAIVFWCSEKALEFLIPAHASACWIIRASPVAGGPDSFGSPAAVWPAAEESVDDETTTAVWSSLGCIALIKMRSLEHDIGKGGVTASLAVRGRAWRQKNAFVFQEDLTHRVGKWRKRLRG